MANTNKAATVWNCPNYTGQLYLIGANQTPFLNMIGGLQGNQIRTVSSFDFAMAQPYALEAASQPAITEAASVNAPTPWTYVRGQDVNTCQIFQRQVSISYAKQSTPGQVSVSGAGLVPLDGQPVQNELDFQIAAHLRQTAIDVEHSFLNGVYQKATSAAVAAKMGGIIPGCATNTIAAANAVLSKTLIDALLRAMAGNGALFQNPVMFVNALQKQRVSGIYGYAPQDRNVGGFNIKQIETDFAMVGVVYDPRVPAGSLLVADLAVVAPVFLPVPGKGVLFYEELSKTGASEKGQIYGQIGLDFGPEEYHGTITGLKTT
jgi:hypothetical protein